MQPAATRGRAAAARCGGAERGAQSPRVAARGAAGPGGQRRDAGRAQKRGAERRRRGVGAGAVARGLAGMPAGRRSWTRVLSALLWVALARCYNVDIGRPVVFRGPNGSFFGYSVLQHYHDSTRW